MLHRSQVAPAASPCPAGGWLGVLGRAAALVTAILAARPVVAGPSPCAVSHPSDERLAWTCRTIGRGETLESLFGERWVEVARFNRIDRVHSRPGVRIKVPVRLDSLECFTPLPDRYAPADTLSRFVLVDLAEQFLGAYEWGRLVFSAPVTAGMGANPTPAGDYELTMADRDHASSLYRYAETTRPYPMTYGLRFHVDRKGIAYWIHGRDLPGYPGSHGCIGLYDEAMQKECAGAPSAPVLSDARRLFEWVVGAPADSVPRMRLDGPRVQIIGAAPGGRTP